MCLFKEQVVVSVTRVKYFNRFQYVSIEVECMGQKGRNTHTQSNARWIDEGTQAQMWRAITEFLPPIL